MSGRLELVLSSSPFDPAPGLRALTLLAVAACLLSACGVGDEVAAQEHASDPSASAETLDTNATTEDLDGVPEEMRDWAYLAAHTPSYQAPTEWDGTITGMKTLWHPNGAKRAEGEYDNSKKTGPWVYWYGNGEKRWEGTYVEDAPQGLERTWYEDGTPRYSGKFIDGLRNGPFSYWHENGQLSLKGPFEDDVREGAFIQWRRNGDFDEQRSGFYRGGKRVRELSPEVRADLLAQLN